MPTLEQETMNRVNELIDKGSEEFDKGDYAGAITFYQSAWDTLPEPKGEYEDSFHLAKYLCKMYLLKGDLVNAKKWSQTMYKCDLERIDSGDRDFWAGKVAYESGELDEAGTLFELANKKSKGRCFSGEDKKYLDFFKYKK